MAIFVKNELKVPDNLSFTYLVASEYSEIQKIRIKIVTIQVEPLKGYNFSSFRGKIAYKLNPISFRYYAYT